MRQGLVYFGASRCHVVVNILKEFHDEYEVKEPKPYRSAYRIHKSKVKLLKENQTFAPILWAGGWDDYTVDLSTVRNQTPEEMNMKTNPITDDGFLRGQFVNGYHEGKYLDNGIYKHNQCAKINGHYGGGD